VGLAGGFRPHPRAIIFDLDRCLIDSRNAWRYCIEEAIAAAEGRRIDAASLVDEYHIRPWRDALGILADSPEEERRLAGLCETMFERSAMKKLLVHDGIGMALDALRGERIELGAISRLPHNVALKQVQSTGLDRFIAVLSATRQGERWHPAERFEACLSFLEAKAFDTAAVSGDRADLAEMARLGAVPFTARWAPGHDENGEAIASPSGMLVAVLRAWAGRGR